MTDKIRWKIEEHLPENQTRCSLRTLLHDQWLLPNRYVHFLRRRHHVLLNGRYAYMNTAVAAGDRVTLAFNGDEFRTPAANDYRPTCEPQVRVLFENRDLVVVNKPQGQKSHPNYHGETWTLMNDVAGYLTAKDCGAFMVHRLDQETSGAMIIAKNPVVVPVLNRLISSGQIHRRYLAVVAGNLTGRGKFTEPLGKDPRDVRKYCVAGENAKPAQTNYQVLASRHNRTLVLLQLATGRTHQLRVHLAYHGHPIIGDPLYGRDGSPRMLLHGATQELVLPFSFKRIQVTAPLPSYFTDYLVKYDLEKLDCK